MKKIKEKGFTLIELLAVIIILAIIALIATPIILDVIEDAKKSAGMSESKMILSGINNYCATAEMKHQLDSSFVNICEDGVEISEVSQMIDLGNAKIVNIVFTNGRVTELTLDSNGYRYILNEDYKTFRIDGEVVNKDDKTPTIIAKQDNIIVEYQSDNKISDYFTATFGSSGGSVSCTIENTNTLEVGTHDVTCTALGNNGKSSSVTKTITVLEEIVDLGIDNSGANVPDLLDNLIPIVYDGENWIYSDGSQTNWYNYTNKQWANAVVLNVDDKNIGDIITESEIDLWYVWIPRYKYRIFNTTYDSKGMDPVQINITFESGTETTGTVTCRDNISTSGTTSETCEDENGSITSSSTYTHPAFTFGDQKLEGIWVGKFENSGSTSAITIKPNVAPIVSQTVSAFYTTNKGISTTYGITDGDSHMTKNMEWGAVAYMKQSQYGLGTTDIALNNYYNTSSSVYYLTGCGSETGTTATTTSCSAYDTPSGLQASSTGTIYGVYDMSGGVWEYVMGVQTDETTLKQINVDNSGFTSPYPESKYYDMYTYNTSNITHTRGKLGDATKETLVTFGSYTGGWYSDHASFPLSTASWFLRGGSADYGAGAGVFSFGNYNGGSYYFYGSRSVVVRTN